MKPCIQEKGNEMESIREADGFKDWIAECAFACKMGEDHMSLPPFEWAGGRAFYWPSMDGWPHGFSDQPMGSH